MAVDLIHAVDVTNRQRMADAASKKQPPVLLGLDLNPIPPASH